MIATMKAGAEAHKQTQQVLQAQVDADRTATDAKTTQLEKYMGDTVAQITNMGCTIAAMRVEAAAASVRAEAAAVNVATAAAAGVTPVFELPHSPAIVLVETKDWNQRRAGRQRELDETVSVFQVHNVFVRRAVERLCGAAGQ